MILLGSKLGYIVAGKLSGSNDFINSPNSMMFMQAPTVVPDTSFNLERFWRLEDIGINEKTDDSADTAAMAYFNRSVRFDDEEGRYQVRWPWKVDNPELPDNYDLSLRRLKSLVQRTKTENLQKYEQIIADQEKTGVIEKAPQVPDGPLTHYLPHHVVIKPERTTTKLRVVYDASSKSTKSTLSLYECLYRGPVFLADLCGLLMRFRLSQIAITSDIEKAFLQISLRPTDRDVTRFLWLRDLSKPLWPDNIICYRFSRVPFGVISSPFLLAAVIRYHLASYRNDLSEKIQRSLYADNVIYGTDNLASAVSYYKQAKEICRAAHMNLREWYSNSGTFMQTLNQEDIGGTTNTKVLGLCWDLQSDSLNCLSVSYPYGKATKRAVLQYIARVFDPCGFLCPVTRTGRVPLQQIWREKYEWDATVPDNIAASWTKHTECLAHLSPIKVPRRLLQQSSREAAALELHAFCDASKTAYGAAIFLLSACEGKLNSMLIFAKGRVCPLKERSIPQLELIAATIATRLIKFAKQELDLKINRTVIWSDSQCVLHWILGRPVATAFVKNRVKEIRLHDRLEFRYVPTKDNPADLITRGIRLRELLKADLWWQGPSWLREGETSWPLQTDFTTANTASFSKPLQRAEELNESLVVDTSAPHSELSLPLLDTKRFSSVTKLVRVVAWVRRFLYNIKPGEKRCGPLKTTEYSEALQVLLKDVQRWHFDAKQLTQHPMRSLERQLGLFQSADGLLRCSGRLDNTDLPFAEKHPILLPKRDETSPLIVKSFHEQLAHAGVQHVVTELRRKYWLTQGRLIRPNNL